MFGNEWWHTQFCRVEIVRSAKGPPVQIKVQDNVQNAGEWKWVGSAQSIRLGKSRDRTTYITGEQKWVGSAQNVHLGKSRDRTTY
ncbi:hypothetical protein FA13DRAFT_1732289, partial [Coprinellus micaceus]